MWRWLKSYFSSARGAVVHAGPNSPLTTDAELSAAGWRYRLGRFACDVMDWHRPSADVGFDGCSQTARCARCSRRILLDSQGNWFASYRQDAELSAVKKARAKAIARAADCYGRDDRGYGAACMEAEALTRTELMLTVGR